MLGDLCCEAEQTWRRMRSVRRCLNQCQDIGLQKRLLIEASQHAKRCRELRHLVRSTAEFRGLESLQCQLLDEILKRILTEAMILQQQ